MRRAIFVLTLLMSGLSSCVTEENWQQTLNTLTEPLEKKYLQWGYHEVDSIISYISDDKIKAYKVWYPAEASQNPNKKYPVVIFANGTGFEAHKYEYIFKHMATWGFIAVGNEDGGSGDGRSTSLSLDYILRENERRDSRLYQHVDIHNIGVAGHSQGGAGVFNAITAFENSKDFKAAFSQSPTHMQLLKDAFKCSYDLSKITIPTMITAMTDTKGILHDADDGKGNRICGLNDLIWMRDAMHKGHPAVPIVIARVADNNKDHGANLRESQPYLLAWMLYWLTNDQEAGTVFFGPNPEIKHNSHWQDVSISSWANTSNGAANIIETYTDLNDGSTLTIDNRTNSEPQVNISLFRLTYIDGGIGKMSDGALTFTATDAAGQPIGGRITFAGDTAHLTFTESSWEYLPKGTTYSFVRGAKVDYEPANPIGGRTYTGSGNGGGLATNVTIKFDKNGKCQCTSDFYQAFTKPVTVDGTYSIRYDIVEVQCQPFGFDTPIVWNFEIIDDGQGLGFNNPNSSDKGSIGTDWLQLKVK